MSRGYLTFFFFFFFLRGKRISYLITTFTTFNNSFAIKIILTGELPVTQKQKLKVWEAVQYKVVFENLTVKMHSGRMYYDEYIIT